MHSKCVQMKIGDPTEAASAFNSQKGAEIVLVVIPANAGDYCCGCACCLPYLRVPSGYFSLWQRWYKHMGEIDPGVKFCYPFYKRVSHVINAATITYSAPSRQVPTADNVMVDINLSLTFAIGPGDHRPFSHAPLARAPFNASSWRVWRCMRRMHSPWPPPRRPPSAALAPLLNFVACLPPVPSWWQVPMRRVISSTSSARRASTSS